MSTITAILTPDSNGNVLVPLPEDLRHRTVKLTATIEAFETSPGVDRQAWETELSAMASDPEIRRELRRIEDEFGFAESDGLDTQ